MSRPWVVMKFGGTSVSTRETWSIIESVARVKLEAEKRPLIVCSAVAGVSNQLEAVLDAATRDEHEPILAAIRARHAQLAEELGVDLEAVVGERLAKLERLVLGISLTREVSPRLHALVMAQGELLSTRLGAAHLEAQGLKVRWLDARRFMRAEKDPRASLRRAFLSATCVHDADSELQAHLEDASVVLTQGFIAHNADRDTVLLGRGGSDTSAAYFAAKMQAEGCEIWTDVPGMFTANPRAIPNARLLRSLDYDEAQEIASTGAKVLHPRCLAPVRRYGIPLEVRCTTRPELEGTRVTSEVSDGSPQVKAISAKTGITLISMSTVGMWQQVGFLSDITACFKAHGLSIDLVSTSETNVTVSLDPTANALDPSTIEALLQDLQTICRAKAIGPCAAVSLVGRKIRAILHKLGTAFELFEEQKIHLLSQAASDLNLSVVIDESQSERLVRELHHLLFDDRKVDAIFGPTWRSLFVDPSESEDSEYTPWWYGRSEALLDLSKREASPLYVYDPETLDASARALRSLNAVSRVFYAIKANSFAPILQRFESEGLGFECVSPGELDHVLEIFPEIDRKRILFTPNFAPRAEYEKAFALGTWVTLDNLFPLEAWPEVFADREIIVRLDPGQGRGHHKYVRTAGVHSKFGVSLDELDRLRELVAASGTRVVGLHAHTGSGIRQPGVWRDTATVLGHIAEDFPDVRVLNLGGGLGVPEKPGQQPLDIEAFGQSLATAAMAHPKLELWLEPGRYLVATAGVLLARVTQLKVKSDLTYVGIDTGMNSLIRPALYGAYHEIINLSRLHEPHTMIANIVGPICESGDTLGYARRIAPAQAGDVLLIGTAGAYGRAMSSHYNLRAPAKDVMLDV